MAMSDLHAGHSTRLRLMLGERESDVLAWLVFTRPSGGTRDEIREAMVAQGVAPRHAEGGVPHALVVLRDLRFANVSQSGQWYATAEGVAAAKRAEAC